MKIIYLIQGKREYVQNFNYLHSGGDILLTLTYDYDFESKVDWLGNIFYPNSTFAQGRNRLYQHVIKGQFPFDYLIYLDDDAFFPDTQWHEKFKHLLKEYQPKFAVPLSDSIKNSKRYIPSLSLEYPRAFDQIVQAYHYSIVPDQGILPFEENFDHLSWWYSCEINQYLILRKYLKKSLQFNDIIVLNKNHHTDNPENSPNSIYKGGMNYKILNQILSKNYKLNYLKKLSYRLKIYVYSRIFSRFLNHD